MRILGPAYTLAKRIEEAAKANEPIIVILRSDGTADIKLPRITGDGYAFFSDRGDIHFIIYDRKEVYRLPGGTPLVVAVEGVPIALDRAKTVLAKALAEPEARKKLGMHIAAAIDTLPEPQRQRLAPLKPSLVNGDVEAIQTAAALLDFRISLDGYGVIDAVSIRELLNPLQRVDRIRIYYEKKTHAFLEKVLQLKLAYETGWSRILRVLVPLLIFAIIFGVLAFFLPKILGPLTQAGGGVRIP